MNIRLSLEAPRTPGAFARVTLHVPDGGPPCELRVDTLPLADLGTPPSDEALELVLLGAVVYALDRRLERAKAVDAWTRDFAFALPVASPQRWTPLKTMLDRCLGFLSGDRWDISFTSRDIDLLHALDDESLTSPNADAASLFSGGLDSLIGVVDHLQADPSHRLLLVGHHDPRLPGPFGDQKATLKHITRAYPDRTRPLLLSVGASSGVDTTLRSRSFLFLALGLYAAAALGDRAPLLIPENGMIALNVPLTPSRAGSCSTRTAHPHYLTMMQELAKGLGFTNPLVNPLEAKTKGECVLDCCNSAMLSDALEDTTSCAKRGHKSTWLRRDAKQCGRCMPCIYRRAALHRVDLDHEIYGRDICAGEVDPSSVNAYADDLRACLTFLERHSSPEDIADLLVASGALDVSRLEAYAGLVSRAMDEIRTLLLDKGVPAIRQRVEQRAATPEGVEKA